MLFTFYKLRYLDECLKITACMNGTYGMDCRYNCTQTCINRESCDKRDGSCTKSITKLFYVKTIQP